MSHQTDGSCIDIEMSRQYSSKARSSFSDKTGKQSGQGLTWSACIGLVLLATALYCGRCAEKELVRLHRHWLDIFPPKHGRLVDRGFRYTTKWYKNLVRAFLPAGLAGKPKDSKFFTHAEVIDARKQSADRYTCEAVFSRVKQFRVLTGRQPIHNLQYINSAWYVAHMVANMYKPLAKPDTLDEWRSERDASANM